MKKITDPKRLLELERKSRVRSAYFNLHGKYNLASKLQRAADNLFTQALKKR